jgi:hypothetical protein
MRWRRVVAAIAPIGDNAFDIRADLFLHVRDRGRALRNPDHSAPGLGSRFGSMTPNVRSNLN